ncbi:MAG: 5-oxoprolinase subunit PxpB [Sulfolobales archaeon]|nr:5-oxoprolinase subunit PxpB [Sulfolobales archaeon]MDW8082762.1 5-oxoprolinase subunit PxpB [Sulfolobales archaeon]
MSTSRDLRVVRSGGYVIHVDVCGEVSLDCAREIHKLYYSIKSELSNQFTEVVPGVSSIAVYYDPRKVSGESIVRRIRDLWQWCRDVDIKDLYRSRKFTIPVVYGGEFGPDLQSIAAWSKLAEDEVVRIHSSRRYTVITLGFTPGFVYMGEVDPSIAAPRLETPRVKIPAGSVGVAGKMTGVYGLESPGGWRLLGRTPLTMFDYRRNPPIPISPGDEVYFKPIDAVDFSKLLGVFVGDYSG